MHYVKQFKINGVDTKQVACIELQGVPNAATEGSVGVLGMDMSSPTHEVYRCVAVNGSVYTWELLSSGMSIISATITGEGGETKSFPYENLRIPNNYIIKVGDLILDSEGYLYQISAIGAVECDTTYCGTHIGGIASGDKDYRLTVTDGKLQMVTESGAIVSNVDYPIPDDITIHRDSSTGIISVLGIKTINDVLLRFFVGTQALYDTLTEEQQKDVFAIITDDPTKERIENTLSELSEKVTGAEEVVGGLVNQLANGSASSWMPYISWLKGGAQKDDLNFISDDGGWSPDPCGSYYSYGETQIVTTTGTETITGWLVRGFHIVDDNYLQLLVTKDKVFMRKLFKWVSTDGNTSRRIADNFIQIAGEGTRVAIADRLGGDFVTLANSISKGETITHSGLTTGVYLLSWDNGYEEIQTSIMDLSMDYAVANSFTLGYGGGAKHYAITLSTTDVMLSDYSEINSISNVRVKRIA